MTPEHFKSRFCLQMTPEDKFPQQGQFLPNKDSKLAAVLVPVVVRPTGLNILFTKRAMHLRHHPGQVSFPGGKFDESDNNLLETALRETHEEIGLLRKHITPLGWLPSLHTISNFTVHPLVSLIKEPNKLIINKDEVDSVFEAPMAYFMSRENHHIIRPSWHKELHRVHFMPYQEQLIWGATANILDKFITHFE